MIDTHCHLNFPEHFPDVRRTLDRSCEAGVSRVIVVGCDTETSARAVELADLHEEVYACIGWHPTYTAKYDSSELETIASLAEHPKVVAIGEIGLDYHWDYATPDEQRRSLNDHFALAQSLNLPVVFHCREAYADLLDWLELQNRRTPNVLHCFAGSADDASRAMNLGCWFGVDGPVTYKNASALRDNVKRLPQDRLLVETDAPYLTPHPYRGKPNEPAYIPLIVSALAATIGLSLEETADLTTRNAHVVFGV